MARQLLIFRPGSSSRHLDGDTQNETGQLVFTARNICREIKRPSLLGVLARRLLPWNAFKHDSECKHLIRAWSSGRINRKVLGEVFPNIEKCDVRIRMAYSGVVGWSVDLQELVCVLSVLKTIRARKVLEIGTYDGVLTLNLAANIEESGAVYTVDLPVEQARIGSKVGSKFRNEKEAARIRQFFGDSTQLNWGDLGGPFDRIIIDGCHESCYVEKDPQNAFSNLSSGEVIFWRDYGHFYEVSDVVDRRAKSFKIVAIKGTRLAVYIADSEDLRAC